MMAAVFVNETARLKATHGSFGSPTRGAYHVAREKAEAALQIKFSFFECNANAMTLVDVGWKQSLSALLDAAAVAR